MHHGLTEETLEALLPRLIEWAEKIAAETVGLPLEAEFITVAKKVGVKEPERIRVVPVDEIPISDDPELRAMYLQAFGDLVSKAIASTVGYVIFVRREVMGAWSARRVLSHELRHVYQFEQAGSIAQYTANMLRELVCNGYENNRYELDADEHTLL